VLNVLAAWLRYAAVVQRSYQLAVVSTVLAGAAAAVVVCSYAVVAHRWFRPTQRGLATSVAVQSNYLGWALGSLIGLANGGSEEAAISLLKWQAIIISASLPAFFLCYRGDAPTEQIAVLPGQSEQGVLGYVGHAPAEEPFSTTTGALPPLQVSSRCDPPLQPHPPALHATTNTSGEGLANTAGKGAEPELSTWKSAKLLFSNGRYWLHALPYATIGGVGFAVPSAQAELFGGTCYAEGASW